MNTNTMINPMEAVDIITKILYETSFGEPAIAFATIATVLDDLRAITDMTVEDESDYLKNLSEAVLAADKVLPPIKPEEVMAAINDINFYPKEKESEEAQC